MNTGRIVVKFYFYRMKRNLLLLLGHIFFWFLIDFIFQISANRTFTLVDDHTIISTYDFVDTFGVFAFLKEVLVDNERFRPMMGINRLFFVLLFGKDIQLISYYFLILGGITSFFLHKFGNLISSGIGILFAVLVTFGMQSVIWWVFDSSENIATMFLSIALFAGYQVFENSKPQLFLKAVFWLSVVLMSLSKESFIFILPFLAILFRKNKQATLFLLLLCFLELLFIKLYIGTTFGYAGVDTATYSLRNISKVIAQYLIRGYGIPLLTILGLLIYQNRGKLKTFWFNNRSYFGVIFVGILPFLLLYAKSGINVGRYLLPMLIPQFYVLFHLMNQVIGTKNRLAVISIVGLFFGYHVIKFAHLQQDFVLENKILRDFGAEINVQTVSDDAILVLANPAEDFERAGALMIYLQSENALDRKKAKLEIIDLESKDNMKGIYEEFRYKNKYLMNTDSLEAYSKWIIINEKVLNKVRLDGTLKPPYKLISKENYSIIVRD